MTHSPLPQWLRLPLPECLAFLLCTITYFFHGLCISLLPIKALVPALVFSNLNLLGITWLSTCDNLTISSSSLQEDIYLLVCNDPCNSTFALSRLVLKSTPNRAQYLRTNERPSP